MNLQFIKYKYRFFIGYIIIGIISILTELLLFNLINDVLSNRLVSSFLSVTSGVVFSFWLNIKYNFKISPSKRNRALIYFIIISYSSYLLQAIFISKLENFFSYEYARIIISAFLFWIAYIFHAKYSFKDLKKVGVAIYSNGVENINEIFSKVENYPDFIHIDIVDKTVNEKSENVLSYKTEVIRGFWNKKFIETHIMSKRPKKWINKIINNVNRIYIHTNLEEDLEKLLLFIKKNGCEAGIVVQNKNDLFYWEKHFEIIDSILVLAIKTPGYSGQKFEMNSLSLINLINNHKFREKISLNVDGGVTNMTIPNIKSENVVSGSYVLNAKNPIRNIMILKTSSQYESV
tara:strand:+ start:366 stop:1406 length:1041 start_codon:yes stop_codon:yes gene_type:complete